MKKYSIIYADPPWRYERNGVQGEIADLALAAASKLMEQKVDDQTNRELVNAFLSEEGAGE